ncbi:ABC transporter ATP-binding protein [Amphibacillus sediminis]|uniref:ABC transporter ATP-binding protein n=1 Tax=Amphibacillus sediminis TaxID=360185 RepID=UPI000831C982|nr:ABC transporter ATP-binding protein [Amphibacillus sediminis]
MIEVEHLSYTYPRMENQALKQIHLSVKKGEILGVLGPSGAGKSTLQKVLLGVLHGYQGTVKVMGIEANQFDSNFYQRMGVSFEVPNFYQKFTALENLNFFRSFYKNKDIDLISMLETVDLLEARNKKVSDFSKGMKMRLSICRAFLHDPELVFLDEPTAGLDPLNIKKVRTFIKQKQAEGKTIILNTHNMQVAEQLCDRVAFIIDGEIKQIVRPNEIIMNRNQRRLTVTYLNQGQQEKVVFPMTRLDQNNAFQALLKQDTILKMETEQPSLEDLFIDITGRSLT